MHRTIRAVLVLISALLFTISHAQTSSADLRQLLLDYGKWRIDVVSVGTALASAYASPPSHSSETVVFAASALSADMLQKALSATTTAWEDLTSSYQTHFENLNVASENENLLHAVFTSYQSLDSIRGPLLALMGSGVPADEWKSAYRDFSLYGELSDLWKAIYTLHY
ncbi:MAG: hypothetical protein KF891_24720 [Rhizobacter sp.]|nr:hypothetical protein [Rhizobacter sp.]